MLYQQCNSGFVPVFACLPQRSALKGILHIGVCPSRQQQRNAFIKALDSSKMQRGAAVIVGRVYVKALLDALCGRTRVVQAYKCCAAACRCTCGNVHTTLLKHQLPDRRPACVHSANQTATPANRRYLLQQRGVAMTCSSQKHQNPVLIMLVHKALQHGTHTEPVAHDLLLPSCHVRQVKGDAVALVISQLAGLSERLSTGPLKRQGTWVLVNHLLEDLSTPQAPEF